MTRLFFTLYLGVMAVLVGMIILSEVIFYALYGDLEAEDISLTVSGYINIFDAVSDDIPPGKIESVLAKTAEINQQVILPLSEFHKELTDEELQTLKTERVLVNTDEEFVGVTLKTGESYILYPKDGPSLLQTVETANNIALIAICLAVALYILIWIYWLRRKLIRLEQGAQQIAAGDLAARVPEKRGQNVGTLNRDFNHMAQRVQTLIESHKQLSNAVAHELRSPIFRLQCQLEMIADCQTDEERQGFADGMADDLHELEELVNELLAYARFERAELHLEKESVQVKSWLEETCEHLQLETPKKLVCGVEDLKVSASIDKHLMQRAITNLIRNAMHHADHTITVRAQKVDKGISLCIDDDGPGIPDSDRDRIFEPFTRLDASRNRNSGGYGLGLAIAKQIVQLHGGHLDCSVSPEGGARFCIQLP